MTPEQIDAVLPRVPAGIPALTGDLTDDEERAEAVRWLLELYREAELVTTGHTAANPAPWPPPHPPAPGITYYENGFGK